MQRKHAEKLLAALIFDDLDEASKTELLAYLETDDELRDRLADLRMAVKVTSNAVKHGPDPVLSKERGEHLARLAGGHRPGLRIFTARRLAAAAVILISGAVIVAVLTPHLSRSRFTALSQPTSYVVHSTPPRSVENQVVPSTAPGPQGGSRVTGDYENYAGYGRVQAEMKDGSPVTLGLTPVPAELQPAWQRSALSDTSSLYQDNGDLKMARVGQPLAVNGPEQGLGESLDKVRVLEMGRDLPAAAATGIEKAEPADKAKPQSPAVLRLGAPVDRPTSGMGGMMGGMGMGGMGMGDMGMGGTMADQDRQQMMDQFRHMQNMTPEQQMAMRDPLARTRSGPDEGREKAGEVARGAQPNVGRVPLLGDQPLVSGSSAEGQSQRNRTAASEGMAGRYGDQVSNQKALGEKGAFVASSSSSLGPDTSQRGRQPAGERTQAWTEQDTSDLPAASRFAVVPVNPWVLTERDRLSTFALDVDTASYAVCRRYIRSGFLPPVGAVRMEEFINHFDYDYAQRSDPTFQVHAEAAPSPFAGQGEGLTLLKIGVKARTIGRDRLRPAHLVFVVDASASMGRADRLPVVQQALDLLVGRLSATDRISLVSYANEARLVLEAAPVQDRDRIRQAVDALQPAGPTNLLAGLKLGYATARRSFVAGQVNHVVLCSDGVANVGQTEADALLLEVAADRRQGITMTCVGVGYGAYNDALLEALADRGDGSYVFLDSAQQAQSVVVDRLAATLQTVARDARIQVDFNPQRIRRYRLIGYENRDMEDARFRDDTADAGEVGSGQCSTALYELELTGQGPADPPQDLGTVFVRYRHAETGHMEEISRRLAPEIVQKRAVQDDPRFYLAAAAARFAEWLHQSEHARNTRLADVLGVLDQVTAALPLDADIRELADLVRQAEGLPRAP